MGRASSRGRLCQRGCPWLACSCSCHRTEMQILRQGPLPSLVFLFQRRSTSFSSCKSFMQIDAFPFGSSAHLLKPFWLQITPNSLSQQKQGEDWTAKQNGRVAAGPRGEPNRDDVKSRRGVSTWHMDGEGKCVELVISESHGDCKGGGWGRTWMLNWND